MKPTSSLRTFLALAGSALLLTVSHAFAANGTWNGTTSDDWQDSANWSAAFPTFGETATFNTTSANTTIDMGTGLNIRNITFDTANVAAYTLGTGGAGGQAFALGDALNAAAITLKSTVANNQIINADITLGDTHQAAFYYFDIEGADDKLTVNGTVTGSSVNSGTAGNKIIWARGAGSVEFTDALTTGATGGLALRMDETVTVTLSGSTSNDFTGSADIRGGTTLILNKSGSAIALDAGLAVTGGTVQYGASAGGNQIADDQSVTLGNSAGLTTLDLNGKSDKIGGLTLFGNASTSSSEVLISTGVGTLTLNDANTAVTVSARAAGDGHLGATISGNLDLNLAAGSRTFNIADSANTDVELLISAEITSTGGAFRKGQAGTVRLTAANTYTGGTIIDAGILEATNIQDGGENSSIGKSTNAAANLFFQNTSAVLRYIGSANASTDRAFTMTANGAIIESSGLGTLSFTDNTVLNSYGTAETLTLGGTNTGANTFGKIISSSTTLNKEGPGTWVLNQDNSYTGATNVNGGTLVVSGTGDINQSSGVVIASGATFRYNSTTALSVGITNNGGSVSGSGNLGSVVLGGTGSIDPGNSPGIMTAGSTDPSGGLDYNFEFTKAGVLPDWDTPAASINDVLRLTGLDPFSSQTLDADNVISIYLDVASLANGNIFTGGFYTDNNADFLAAINSATFQYFLADDMGLTDYMGNTYTAYSGPLSFSWSTVSQTADFGAGNVNGFVSQFAVIPEPSAALLGSLGLLALLRRRR